MKSSAQIREPAVAGTFYPRSTAALKSQVEELLGQVPAKDLGGQVVALISPHAGYMYSGFTAAHGFKLLTGRTYRTVVIISPSHREYFDGISVYNGEAYRTPLGEVGIDRELREEFVTGHGSIVISQFGHGEEHAVEVQIPFLQEVLPPFMILPVVMGDQRREYCFLLGERLGEVLKGKNVLLVASTDLSHYYQYDVCRKLDSIFIDAVKRFDVERLMEDLETERTEACGGGPTVAAMIAAKNLGAVNSEILHHCNSGDVSGNKSQVVGYLSAVLWQ